MDRSTLMKGERWQRVEQIFGEAIELPPEEQQQHLAARCRDDRELYRQVETLLRANRAAGSFLEDAAPLPHPADSESSSEATTPVAPLAEGERLGPYRVLRQIGAGGMGTVFLAERDDGSFDRRVAIKVLRHGTESDAAVERLERERQILASLDHPGIARLLDGGTTASGLPYVVMELVEGEPIDRACEQRQLAPVARVDLLLAVCDAVTAAHRKLVVHRDLKPSNILIDRQGHPKLLDFGIAKLLESGSGGDSAELTASWERRLTPSYASPEQLTGARITVATDVYLLGVVLYELLTGSVPYRFESRSFAAAERLVTTQIPPRPSALAPELDADLDAILLKALRSDPQQRYGSVEELAADLRRYREGRPVSARQGQLSYVASKFIRRHWIPIATALLFTALIAAFAVSTAVQANRNARTLGRLVAVERFLADLFGAVSPEIAKGRQIPVDEVLQRGERQLDLGLIREAGSRGLLHALFGRIALHLGDLTQAQDHLERALEAYQEVTNDPYIGLAEIRARGDLALVTLYQGRDAAEAETLAREALALGRDHPQLDRPALLRLLNTVTMIYCLQGNWAEARPLADEAYALSTAAGAPPSLQAAAALSLRALLEKNQDQKPEEASRLYARSLTIYRQLEGDTHPDIAAVLNQLGLLATARGDTASATRHLGEALEVRQRLYPQGHWEIGQSLYQLGIVHRRSADLNRAEELLHEAWQVYVRERGPEYGRTIFMWLHLADVRFALGRAQEAEAMLEELTPAWWASRKPTSRLLPLARRVLGCTLGALGRLAEAEDLLQLSLDALQDQQGPEAWETRAARACLDDVRARRQETVDE